MVGKVCLPISEAVGEEATAPGYLVLVVAAAALANSASASRSP
jgi:hypothetical protein